MSFKKGNAVWGLGLMIIFTACKKDNFKEINQLIPEKMLDEISQHMPIYEGNTPPKIEGNYIISPCELLYCSNQPDLEYTFDDYTFKFYNQKKINNYQTITFVGDNSLMRIDSCDYTYIMGKENHFTAYYSIKENHFSGIKYKAAVLISGTKIPQGIADMYLAILILKKSNSMNDDFMMPEKSFRIIYDKDNLVESLDTAETL